MAREVRHLKIRGARMRAIIHEAWKAGNESYNIHEEPAGESERKAYVDSVMVQQQFIKEPQDVQANH